jgi:8-oxo-dGTP pyrophosphatase MutT (NUDIX family)/phosphohistidine phosphatase SixA
VASSQPIEAAGGVLWREDGERVDVAVVHRPRYDDWSLPKGKAHRGELPVVTALREVREETGANVALSRRVGRGRYRVAGIDKVVRYWAMRYRGGPFTPNAEVDDLAWLDADHARARLSYDNDRAILDALFALPLPTSAVILIRHAKAGKRAAWKGIDERRPLDRVGREQARALVPLVGAFDPVRILSAGPLRCVQTVEPLASKLGLGIEPTPAFGDDCYARDPEATRTALKSLAAAGNVVAVSSQGVTIPGIIESLELSRPVPPSTAKGAAWVLSCRDGQVVSADYYRAPAHLRRASR